MGQGAFFFKDSEPKWCWKGRGWKLLSKWMNNMFLGLGG